MKNLIILSTIFVVIFTSLFTLASAQTSYGYYCEGEHFYSCCDKGIGCDCTLPEKCVGTASCPGSCNFKGCPGTCSEGALPKYWCANYYAKACSEPCRTTTGYYKPPVDRDLSSIACLSTATNCNVAYWNIGGEVAATTCCQDDVSEYRIVSTGISNDGTDACCNANNKCVYGNTCYSNGANHPTNNCVYCNAGAWAAKASGADCGVCKTCNGAGACSVQPADDPDCGTIDCDGRNYYHQSGTESPTATETCYYRDYADITSNRCEGLGDCKDANTGDCTTYSDLPQYSCGTCKYISTSSCTGGTRGSCSNYGTSSQCNSAFACSPGSGNNNYGTGGDYRCQGYCDGGGSCDYAGNCEDCNSYDCTTGLTCTPVDVDTIRVDGEDYSCSGGSCVTVGTMTCAGPWDCTTGDCSTRDCVGLTHYCYMSNGGVLIFAPLPESVETACADGYDNDCNGLIDCDDTDCAGDPVCGVEICDNGVNDDADGLIDCADPDCPEGTICGAFRDCPNDYCDPVTGGLAHLYPSDDYDRCDASGNCKVWGDTNDDGIPCDKVSYCTDTEPYEEDGVDGFMCGATCDEDGDCSAGETCDQYCDCVSEGTTVPPHGCNTCPPNPDCYLQDDVVYDFPGVYDYEYYEYDTDKVPSMDYELFATGNPPGNYEVCAIDEANTCPDTTNPNFCEDAGIPFSMGNMQPVDDPFWLLVHRKDDSGEAGYTIKVMRGPILPNPNTCDETDNRKYEQRGKVYGYKDWIEYEYWDTCIDGRRLSETYCDGSTPKSEIYDCKNLGSNYRCSLGECKTGGGGGGCPTLFVYDGKEYKKERISSIHSQEGIDTLDEIELTVEPVVVDGYYQLLLREQFFPGHSHVDNVRLFVDGEEAKLISAWHSKYGDVTSILAKSDDVRTDTKLWDEIELKFAATKAESFLVKIEGYNPVTFPRKVLLDITPEQLSLVVIIVVLLLIGIALWLPKLMRKKTKKKR